jgi:hypothetical protein
MGEGITDGFVATIDTPDRLATMVEGQTRSFKVVAHPVSAGGRKATALVANGMAVWVSPAPARVTRILSQPGQGEVPVPPIDLALDQYGARVDVPALPVQPLDLELPENAVPMFHEVPGSAVTLTGCDLAGCTVSATVANSGGMLGKVIVTLDVSRDRVTPVATCQVALDPTPVGDQQTIHCRATFATGGDVYVAVEFKTV